MSNDDSWKALGNCHDVDPSVMFPIDHTGVGRAKRVCWNCPVLGVCLAFAVNNHEEHGIWGGMTESERSGRSGRPGPRPKPCGTRAAYCRGCRCDPCVEASRAYQAARAFRSRRKVDQ